MPRALGAGRRRAGLGGRLLPRHRRLAQRGHAIHGRGRMVPVGADYGWARIAAHTLKSWLLFLRRPAVVAALLLWLAALMLGRAPPGAAPLALWVLLYTLALSPAYYTPRAALLPVLAATALT